VRFASGADPFYNMFGARLAGLDALSSLAFPFLFHAALKWRRKVHLHARYMLAPILFLLSPILSRLLPAVPPLAIAGPEDFYLFGYGVHVANAFAAGLAAFLYWRAPRHGLPFLIVGAIIVAHSLIFETLGKSAAWERLFVAIGSAPVSAVASLGLAAGVAAAWTGWSAGRIPTRGPAAA
jgi:hypothetical protein